MSEILSSKSEINTNMKLVEMKGNVVDQLEGMNEEEREYAISVISKFLVEKKEPNFVTLLSNELRYFTTFEINTVGSPKLAAKNIVEFLETDSYLMTLGKLKLVDENPDHVEVWLGNTFFALFDYDGFIVEI